MNDKLDYVLSQQKNKDFEVKHASFEQNKVFYSKEWEHLYKTFLCFNPLPDDKILDWSKLKQMEDDILQCI